MRWRLIVPLVVALCLSVLVVLKLGAAPAGISVGVPTTSPSTGSQLPSGVVSSAGTPSQTIPMPDPSANKPQPAFSVTKLKPGEKPPQFVVMSFDGACKDELFNHFMQVADRNQARFTWFLSGLCLLGDKDRFQYRPPGKLPGSSAIGFAEAPLIPGRIRNLSAAYLKGHEIGTHALGHFCGPTGVKTWNSAAWTSEMSQAYSFLDNWRANLDKINPALSKGVPDLPFNASTIKGIRTPCLEGHRNQMWPVWTKFGFKYDASSAGELEWPIRIKHTTLWEFPLQLIDVVGFNKRALSMDYNFMCQQNRCSNKATAAVSKRVEDSAYASYMNALHSVCDGNRAPLNIGNHLNTWVNDAYTNALTRFVDTSRQVCPDVQFVPFIDVAKWLDVQDQSALKALRNKGIQREK